MESKRRGAVPFFEHAVRVRSRTRLAKPGSTAFRAYRPVAPTHIVALSKFSEDLIREKTACSKSNWDNAKKILPKFAEQLGDVRKVAHQGFYLADISRQPRRRHE
jgi:hypothetical protein